MLWIPPNTRPRVSLEARNALSASLISDGLEKTSIKGVQLIRDRHQPLGRYIVQLGQILNPLAVEGDWPSTVIKMGAALTMWAYHETGYCQEVDEAAFTKGSLLAEIDGIPDTYVISMSSDPGIADLSAEIVGLQLLADDGGGLVQVLDIGAGCARHYLQQAIAA